MELIEIDIVNWSKFNPRKDVKTSTWFRMDNRFFLDPKFFDLTCDQKIGWIWMLSTASQNYSPRVKISPVQLSSIINGNLDHAYELISILESREVIKVTKRIRSDPLRVRPEKLPTNERTDERTNERTNKHTCAKPAKPHPAEVLELAELWIAHAATYLPTRKFDRTKFADAILKTCKATGLSPVELREVFEFASRHDWWASRTLSPAGLLKKSERNDLRKIDNLLVEFKRKFDKVNRVVDWVEQGDVIPFDPFKGVK